MVTKRNYWIFILFALLLVLGINIAEAQPGAIWMGRFYNTTDLTGAVMFTTTTDEIAYNWGLGAPIAGMNSDAFSARWTTTTFFNNSTYRFYLFADDGVRLYVDNILVLDTFAQPQPAQLLTIDRPMTAGTHTIQIDYQERGGEAYLYAGWDDMAMMPTEPNLPLLSNMPLSGVSWTGQYYNSTTPSGSPVAIVTTSDIDFDWGSGSPLASVNTDNFSARWQATATLNGTYRIDVSADDGVRVYIDGINYINEWHTAQARTYSTTFTVTPGLHTIIVEYFEATGVAFIEFDITPVSGTDYDLPGGIWRAEYFDNPDVSGSPLKVELVYTPMSDWRLDPPTPLVSADNFSVRWTSHPILAEGTYRFDIQADDGVRLYVDGVLQIDHWHSARAEVYSAEVPLQQGEHEIVVEFFDNNLLAFLTYTMTRIGDYTPQPQDTGAIGTITAFRLNVRSLPDANTGAVIAKVNEGESFPIVGRNADSTWWQIQLPDGQLGWVFGRYVDAINTSRVPITSELGAMPSVPLTGYTLTVTDVTNVRSGPSTRYSILGEIPRGGVAQIAGRNNRGTWFYVSYNGLVGWIAGTLAQLPPGVNVNDLPIVP